jgi:protein ImuB
MTFVALSIADWPTDAAANDLLAGLLAVAPRAAVAPTERLAWLDARSLDAPALAMQAHAAVTALGLQHCTVGIARVPVVAAIAARQQEHRDRALAPSVVQQVPPGTEREWLAPLPLEVLSTESRLLSLFAGVGLETCGDLARLPHAAVAVRFGPEGVTAWRVARADDRRPIFNARPRELPNASLDWTEFSTTDLEQLVFVLHSLLKTVCDALLLQGMGARALTLDLLLENRQRIRQSVGAARTTAQRTTWLRLMRRALERITLPDRVTGIAVHVDAALPPTIRQGDLFDLGFATAEAAEQAVAHVLDLQPDAVGTLQYHAHPLLERRVRWRVGESLDSLRPAPVPLSASSTPCLEPQLFPIAREIDVLTRPRRGFAVPVRYTDNGVVHPLRECLGPHCLSGEHWAEAFTREYHQAIRTDGVMVLLYRDAISERWYVSGWWE